MDRAFPWGLGPFVLRGKEGNLLFQKLGNGVGKEGIDIGS